MASTLLAVNSDKNSTTNKLNPTWCLSLPSTPIPPPSLNFKEHALSFLLSFTQILHPHRILLALEAPAGGPQQDAPALSLCSLWQPSVLRGCIGKGLECALYWAPKEDTSLFWPSHGFVVI